MFFPFLYELRSRNVPVGPHEAISLAKALHAGLHRSSVDGFYHVARALLVHDERHLDAFDEAFLHNFLGIEGKAVQLKQELLDWLRDAGLRIPELTDEERELFERFDLDELKRLFEQTMAEQTERHDGGDRWVGTGGKSPFGHGGAKRPGIRVGGMGRHRSAVQVAGARHYRPYRSDLTIDVHQIGMALRRLRAFAREGAEEELDLQGTVDATAQNAGELELMMMPPKRPNVRVILMMDVGGSMDPYAYLCSRLFTAAKKANHFKELRCYYFHNCVYGNVYSTEDLERSIPVNDLLRECDKRYKLIMVGDALMAPFELFREFGAIDYGSHNRLPGIAWLLMLAQHFERSVWINPEPSRYWPNSTIEHIAGVFAMYNFTLDGLSDAMLYLSRSPEKKVK